MTNKIFYKAHRAKSFTLIEIKLFSICRLFRSVRHGDFIKKKYYMKIIFY